MKTKEEVLAHFADYETPIQDRFGSRLCLFLTEEEANKIGFERVDKNKPWETPKEWTKENIIAQLKEDVALGFEKALNQRGISSSLMFDVVRKWNIVLEDGLENYDENNYAQYGLPLFKATAVKYGFDNPIGEDSGCERTYAG